MVCNRNKNVAKIDKLWISFSGLQYGSCCSTYNTSLLRKVFLFNNPNTTTPIKWMMSDAMMSMKWSLVELNQVEHHFRKAARMFKQTSSLISTVTLLYNTPNSYISKQVSMPETISTRNSTLQHQTCPFPRTFPSLKRHILFKKKFLHS